MKTIKLYLVLDVLENITENVLEPIAFFPVFSSIEAARNEYPDTTIIPILISEDELTVQ